MGWGRGRNILSPHSQRETNLSLWKKVNIPLPPPPPSPPPNARYIPTCAKEGRNNIGVMKAVHHTHAQAQRRSSQPPTVVCEMEAQLELCTHNSCTRFCTFGTKFACAQSVLINKKFLHLSSIESLLRMRCWLGRLLLPASRT